MHKIPVAMEADLMSTDLTVERVVGSVEGIGLPMDQTRVATARARADNIRQAADDLWRLLEEAWLAEDWRVLGHSSWACYVWVEFGMSRSRAYQLLRHAQLIRELKGVSTDVDIDSEDVEALTEGQTRGADVKEVLRQVAEGKPPAEAVKQAKCRPSGNGRGDKQKVGSLRTTARRLLERVEVVEEKFEDIEQVEPAVARECAQTIDEATDRLSSVAEQLRARALS
jgi:hypothetical protein